MPRRSTDPILIAGTGRVAQAMGRLLAEQGEPVLAVAGRDPARAAAAAAFIGYGARAAALNAPPKRATRVLVAVSDNAIGEVARTLAEAGVKRGAALHTCGAMGREALAPLAAAGVACGAIHPLQTVASPEQGLSALAGCVFAVDGDPPALAWAESIARALGGSSLRIPPEARPLYHAAAVMAANYVVALVDAAAMLMKAAGVEQCVALRALSPLVEASATNALRLGPVEALTGPIRRGDLTTLRGHVRALEGAPETVRDLYCSAGLHALDIAVRGGLEPGRARRIEKLLREGVLENGGSDEAD
jgi:predicted short-subunit dehydrogenase-like oxidoreductase (DUF2520 family)